MKKNNHHRSGGIRNRVMLYLVLFVVLVIAMLWLFQIVLLDDFYQAHKERQVKSASDVLVSNIDNEDLSVLAERLAAQYDMCVLLLDAEQKTILSSDDIRFCLIHRMSSRDLHWWCDIIPDDGSTLLERFNVQPYRIDRYNDRLFRGRVPDIDNSQALNLLCARRVTLADGTQGYLLLNTQLTPLTATVDTLRTQLTVITVAVLLGAVFLAWLISRRVSRPIVLISRAAQDLAQSHYEPPKLARSYREIDELNITLNRAAAELSQVEHLQHELIANISHDLRTPLTMISGYAEVMRDIPDENTPENMQVIIDETARLSTLVNEILDFSRLQTGTLSLEPRVFCLTDTVAAIASRVGKLVEKDGYSIHFEPADPVMVTADETRIGQVVYNLLGNALTYTGADKQVFLTQDIHGQHVRLSIRDTGKGIPPEELPLIWNRYYRTHESHKRAVIGSGIGLSIVHGILEQHSARYGVDSSDAGSVFWFELPIAEDSDQP